MCMNSEHKIVCGVAGIHFYGLNVLKKKQFIQQAVDGRRELSAASRNYR